MMSTIVGESRPMRLRIRIENMNVERKRETTPVLVAAVDNDRMALLALKGILPQLLPSSQ